MRFILPQLALAVASCYAQNCPLLGPAYPAATDLASPALLAAKAKFDEALASDPRINRDGLWFAIDIYSTGSKHPASIHRSFNTAKAQNGSITVGPDTLFRIFSISKVVTVYTMLAKLSYRCWHEPVTKYVPELAKSPMRDVVSNVNWSEVTLGSLASQISGISRDWKYPSTSKASEPGIIANALVDALSDGSSVFSSLPGLRKLKASELVRCGSPPLKACSRTDAMSYVLQTWPLAPSFRTPNYSNMAFQLLAYAVERITNTPFPDLVKEQIINPLNLTRTFLTHPGNDTNAVVYDGWDLDFGDEAPYVPPSPLNPQANPPSRAAGYFSTLTDVTTLGHSILHSSLLPPLTTRKWLKPTTHTSSTLFSLGSPWEILRCPVPVTSNATKTLSLIHI